jgi:hypothetical protein
MMPQFEVVDLFGAKLTVAAVLDAHRADARRAVMAPTPSTCSGTLAGNVAISAAGDDRLDDRP